MKKTRRFVALLLAAVLALALFTACGAAQPTIGEEYEKWFVEQLNSKRPADKPAQKVDVKRSEMRAALAKISEDGKFTAKDGYYEKDYGSKESSYWLIISNPRAWLSRVPDDSIVDAIALTPENMTQYGPNYFIKWEQLYRIDEYDIVTRVMDGNTYAAVYLHLEEAKS